MNQATTQLPPPRAPGYEILSKLGEGGMGQVFLAREISSQRTVAVKFLTSIDGERPARFAREAQVAARLAHDHLVAVLDQAVEANPPFLVMEYVEGGNLRSLMQRGQALEASRVAAVMSQLVGALDYLASQGIVHRDLKPENVLLTAEGQVKVADFGLASRVSQLGAFTQTGQALGTFDYMAPEQRSRLPVDERADQYAAAVLAYEMLTGKLPIGRFKPPSYLNLRLHPAVDEVLGKALQEDPDDRYGSIREFGAALTRALIARPLPRWRPVLIAAPLIAALVGAVVWWQLPQPVMLEPEQVVATDPPEVVSVKQRVNELVQRGLAADAKGDRTLAVASYSEAVAIAPNDPLPLVRRAHSLSMLGMYDEAMTNVEKAIKLDPSYPEAWLGRGAINLHRNRHAEARPDLDKAIELAPNLALAYAHRGRVRRVNGDNDGAAADLTRAIQLDPRCGIAYHYRGLIAQEQKRTKDAINDFKKSVECTPDISFAHRALATLLATCSNRDLRDGKLAVKHATLACELNGWKSYRDVRILGLAYAEAGDLASAISYSEKSLTMGPPASERKQIELALRSFQSRQAKTKGPPQ